MTGGPDDGAHLYDDGEEPCLLCGRLINIDWDGVLCWHIPEVPLVRGERIFYDWCPGSRTAPMRVPS